MILRRCFSFGRNSFDHISTRNLIVKSLYTKSTVEPELDAKVQEDVENERIKIRKHPGRRRVGTCALPEHIVRSISIIAENSPIKAIVNDAKMLSNYLFSRHYPWEEEDLKERQRGFTEDVKNKLGNLSDDASEEQVRHYNHIVKSTVGQLMQKFKYRWSPLDLHDYSCMVYLFTRGAANYAAALRVLHEITIKCPDYRPQTLFDFGSGVGSMSWAVRSVWGESVTQYMNIDSSSSMNDLAILILKGGDNEAPPPLNVHYRAFLPAQPSQHSIVTSAHSLLELPSRESRLQILLNLWQKTQDFLIILEQGTKPGFKVVSEARDFILSLSTAETPAHVLAPCVHDKECPRVLRGPYPCHIQVKYFDLDIGKRQDLRRDLISYVIIRKGTRPEQEEWPRVVRPVLQRHNHVICRLCTQQGKLEEIIFTKKRHGKVLYRFAKKTEWGDLLPVSVHEMEKTDSQPEEDTSKPD